MNSHTPLCPSGFSQTQESTPTPRIKDEPEELSIKQEEELPYLESTCVKKEEASPSPQQSQSEHQDKTYDEDISSELGCEIKTENSDEDDDWLRPLSSSESSETEADEDHSKQVQIRRDKYASETGALGNNENNGLTLGTDEGAESKENNPKKEGYANEGDDSMKYQCLFCQKRYKNKQNLLVHSRVHTGERPFSCGVCMKTFFQRSHLQAHKRVHTKEKPYSCSICKKTFNHSGHLNVHKRTHTSDKPFHCTVCKKTFSQRDYLDGHMRTHTGEKPYSCTICKKTFTQKGTLGRHIKCQHTGNKSYSVEGNISLTVSV